MTLPTGWELVRFEDLVDVIRGVTFSKGQRREEISDGYVACLRSGNVQNDLTLDNLIYVPDAIVKSEARVVRPGDTIVSMSNSYELVGKVALATERHAGMTFGAFLSVFRSPVLESKFLFSLLRAPDMQSAMRATASQTVNISNISMSGLAGLQIPVPPLAEQRRIVAKLDALTARLTRARAELDRVKNLAKLLRSKILQAEFSGPATNQTATLGDVASVISGNAFKSPDFISGSGIPLIRIGDISKGAVHLESAACLPAAFLERHRKFSVAKDDILVALSGATTGKSGLYPHDNPALLNQRVARIRITAPVEGDAEYVMRFTEFHAARILQAAYGAAQPNISHNRLKELRLHWPAAEARRARSCTLSTRLGHVHRLEAEAARGRSLLDRVEAALLSRAFRGQLIPQNPIDEPASALLARTLTDRNIRPKLKRRRSTS